MVSSGRNSNYGNRLDIRQTIILSTKDCVDNLWTYSIRTRTTSNPMFHKGEPELDQAQSTAKERGKSPNKQEQDLTNVITGVTFFILLLGIALMQKRKKH